MRIRAGGSFLDQAGTSVAIFRFEMVGTGHCLDELNPSSPQIPA